MSEEAPFETNRGLFARWRAARAPTAPPDEMTIAAYAEGRLGEATASTLEAALAADPGLLDTVLAVWAGLAPELPSRAVLRRAQALVPDSGRAMPLRRRFGLPAGPPLTRFVLAWGAVAASLILVSLVGFNLGIETHQALNPAPVGSSFDLFDANTGDGLG